jgi:hypothetical protein
MTEIQWQEVRPQEFALQLDMLKASPIKFKRTTDWAHDPPEPMYYHEDTGKGMWTQERVFFYRTLKWPGHRPKYFVNKAVVTW